tara:strand:+ start:408 stop:1088 length:681 start_codon:yes stop_codon:yes gene_type:complete
MVVDGIWLASASSRRYIILEQFIKKNDFPIKLISEPLIEDEIKPHCSSLRETVFLVTKMKLKNAMMEISLGRLEQLNFGIGKNIITIVSDTLVEDPDSFEQVFGKANNKLEAIGMLKSLSGRRHKVWTSTGLILHNSMELEITRSPEIVSGEWLGYIWTDYSTVEFENLTDEILVELLNSKSWLGKAGAYDLDGKMSKYSKVISGDKITVLGISTNSMEFLETLLR